MKLLQKIDIRIEPDTLLIFHQHNAENVAELNDSPFGTEIRIGWIKPLEDRFGQDAAGVMQFDARRYVLDRGVSEELYPLTSHPH